MHALNFYTIHTKILTRWYPYLQQLIWSRSLAERIKSKKILSQYIQSCQSTKSQSLYFGYQWLWLLVWVHVGVLAFSYWLEWSDNSSADWEINQKEHTGTRVLDYFTWVSSVALRIAYGLEMLCYAHTNQGTRSFWKTMCLTAVQWLHFLIKQVLL